MHVHIYVTVLIDYECVWDIHIEYPIFNDGLNLYICFLIQLKPKHYSLCKSSTHLQIYGNMLYIYIHIIVYMSKNNLI